MDVRIEPSKPDIPQGPHWDEDQACFVAEACDRSISAKGWKWVPRNARALAKGRPDKKLTQFVPPRPDKSAASEALAAEIDPRTLARNSDIEKLARKMCEAENPNVPPDAKFVAGAPYRVRDGHIVQAGVPLWTVYAGMAALAYDFEKTMATEADGE
jgi:hypothetical protein